MEEGNKKYEANFIFRDPGGREELSGVFEKLGVAVLEESPLARIRLSYPMDKENLAFLGRFIISLVPESLSDLNKELEAKRFILRFMITKTSIKDLAEPLKAETARERITTEGEKEPIKKKPALARELARATENQGRESRRSVRQEGFGAELSNEALEKKLEEILK